MATDILTQGCTFGEMLRKAKTKYKDADKIKFNIISVLTHLTHGYLVDGAEVNYSLVSRHFPFQQQSAPFTPCTLVPSDVLGCLFPSV